VLARQGREPRVAALFSGGIDSTLIHTYLPPTVPALYHELPSHAVGFGSCQGICRI
jgi:asparagine synthetase B (glutamine-hydrolysing)